MLVSLYKIEELYIRILGTNAFHVKAENEQFTAVGSPRCQNLLYENFKSSYLPEYVKRIASKRVVRATQLFFILYSDSWNNYFMSQIMWTFVLEWVPNQSVREDIRSLESNCTENFPT